MVRLARRSVLLAFGGLVLCLAPPAAAAPEQVHMGIYLAGVHGLDFSTGRYSADFWLWSIAGSDHFSPVETAYIVNEADKSPEPTQTVRSADKRWDQRRIRADLWADWNVARFPFDHQVLTIAVEDSSATTGQLLYVADQENSGIDPGLSIPGWHVLDWSIAA